MTSLHSYWLDSAPTFSQAERDGPEGRADVAIIGGGLTGLSAALSLARAGATVSLFEAGDVVGEASGRNGGQCNNGTLQDYVALCKSIGTERASAYYRAFDAAVDTVENLAESENIDCDFIRTGKLKLAAKLSHYHGLARTFDALRHQIDPSVKLLNAEEVRQEVDSSSFHGGLLLPRSAQLHVGKLGVGLAERAATAGARIFQSTPVTGITRSTGGWKLSMPAGELEADQVFLATGGSGPGPFGWFRRRIIPVGSFIVVTEPLAPQQIDSLLPKCRSYVTSKNIGNYFRRTPDNRLLFGGRARFAVSNPRSDVKSGEVLRTALCSMFPSLADIRIDYCWGGTVDMSADRFPHAGERDGLYYSMGYSGHGVQMAVHMGQIMADTIQGKSVHNPWAGQAWPPIPGHFGKPWFLPAVGVYYRLLDALN